MIMCTMTTRNLQLDDCTTLKEVEKYVDNQYYCGQDIIDLWKENQELKAELQKETVRKECSYKTEIRLEEENRELRKTRFKRFGEEEYWIFQEDEDNYLRSLICPVTISPVYLQSILELLWENTMWLEFVLEQDSGIWDANQLGSAELCISGAKDLLANMERENNKGTN